MSTGIDGPSFDTLGGVEPVLVDAAASPLKFPAFADFTGVARSKLASLERDWDVEMRETLRRRKQRKIDINVREARRTKKIAKDATIIPVRVAHTNIGREMPPFLAYLKQSRRIAIFKDVERPDANVELVESEFTRVAQYDSWELAHYKVLDGSKAHGWDFVEVVFDVTKPGHFAVEHVGHDQLFFPTDSINLQNCEFVVRRYEVTTNQLRLFVKNNGFDAKQVEQLVQKDAAEATSKCKQIRKVMYKDTDTGLVMVAWYSLEDCNEWLKKPEPLFLGVREQVDETVLVPQVDPLTGAVLQVPQQTKTWKDVYETDYPYEALFYDETEEPKIFDHKGRIWLDQYKQEAHTSIWTGFCNRLTRSANVYCSPRTSNNGEQIPKLVSMELVNGGIYSIPLDFWSVAGPDPTVINALQYMESANANETNQVAWAVNNRKDSRKTAAEIEAATGQAALINSVQVTLFSMFVRRVYTRAWRVVQSRALQGRITFAGLPSLPEAAQLVGRKYEIYAAGDVDVIQRQEKLQKKIAFWPYVSQTPIALEFLGSMMKDAFPDDGAVWAAKLEKAMAAQQQAQGLQQALATALAGMVQQFGQSMDEQQLGQVTQILQAASPQGANGKAPQ